MSEKNIRNLIDRTLANYAKRRGVSIPEAFAYDLLVTRDPSHGDFASNIAFKLAGVLREKPASLADQFVLMIQESGDSSSKGGIDRVVVAGGGFINFYLTKTSLAQILVEVHKKDADFGRSNYGKGMKALLEFVSANPTGPLTIAHGRQAAVGDCLARILNVTGHEVVREYYLNDAGRQIRVLGASLWARYCDELGMNASLPEDGYRGAYLIDIAKKLVAEKQDALLKMPLDESLEFCKEYAASSIMKQIRVDLAEMRVVFDHYFSEQSLYKKDAVNDALQDLKGKGFLYEMDGALWFRSTTFGDDKDRVVRKSTGEYTYLAPDLAYHRHKFERGYQWLINLWGPDHHGYIPRLKAACQALGHDPDEVDVLIVQLTTLFREGQPVRMSTRAGEFVTLRELMDEVGVDATRFFFIMRKVESHLDFDLDLAKQKSQENPVYYLQYAHARIQSLLRFSGQEVTPQVNLELLESEEERNLIKLISDYPKALIAAAEFLEPYRVADYLRELAVSFHKFYSLHRVVTDDAQLTRARLLLCDAARIILRNGLDVLGLSQPDSM